MSSFIQQAVDTGSVQHVVLPPPPASTEFPGTETIADAVPGKIEVFQPDKYDSTVDDHEETHQYQFTRADGTVHLPYGYAFAPFGTVQSSAPEAYPAGDPRNYDYGGEDGLVAARNSGKTMADFNVEQQADIVADYQRKQNNYLVTLRSGKATRADLAAMYKTHEAYHTLVQQLANVPAASAPILPSLKTLVGVGKPDPLAPAPSAPGLPDYGVAGMGVAPADPLLSGRSADIKVTR